MKQLIKTIIFILFLIYGKETKGQNVDLSMTNATNYNLVITVLDATSTPLTGMSNIALNANTTLTWYCSTFNAYPAYFQVDYGTCNSIIVDLTGTIFGPFTPLVPPCYPGGAVSMSGSISPWRTPLPSQFGCMLNGYQIHLNIQ